jgi:REP element-mobilizing transposase RayT
MIAYHCIFGMYGFWLPNDPRGSYSDYVAVWELFRYGRATKTDSRQSVAAVAHDAALRREAKEWLKFPPVELTGAQAVAVVAGFAKACDEGNYRVHACAVLPDHVHLVIGSHPREIRRIVGHLRSRATTTLKKGELWRAEDRPIWGEHGWNVYLDKPADVWRAIEYVEQNPIKEGKKLQRWSIVTPFDAGVVQARRVEKSRRRIGGAALRSAEEKARRERRG